MFYQLVMSGNTYNVYLPYEVSWEWQEVEFPVLGIWLSAFIWIFVSGICLMPRLSTYLASLTFAAYFLYGAANRAPVDFFLGFGEVVVTIFSPLMTDNMLKSLSSIWETLHFPGLSIYAFHFYLPFYVGFTSLLTFVYYPARSGSPRHRPSWVDLLLSTGTLVFTIEYIVNFADRGDRAGLILWSDVIMGTIAIIVSIEMCRRIHGWILPLLGIVFFGYAMYGNYFPGRLVHKGFDFNEVTNFVYGNDGIYGVIANVYASYVFLFILFGVFLEKTKVGDVFVDLAFAIVGKLRGGPAKAAVVSSGLVGMVVGSGAANIVITGTFTIPLMKRAGYMAHYAGAVEAVASIGGHLMPPVMGSAAFLVAAFTETDYGYIALISFIPALMYYFSLYMSVHHRSGLRGIHGLPADQIPVLSTLLKKDGYLLLPVVLLILRLVIGRSPFDAALWSIVLAMVLGFFREDTRLLSFPPLLAKFLGLTHWGTDQDRLKLQADRARSAALREGKTKDEADKVYIKTLDDIQYTFPGVGLKENWTLGVGLVVFIFALFQEAGIGTAIFWGLLVMFVLASPRVLDGLAKGAQDSLAIGVTAGVMGIVLAGVSMPGLGLKFSSIVLSYSRLLVDAFGWAGTELPMAIVLCASASYILGMGMTITASYVLLSILAVPALKELGVPLLNAHLIILWQTQYASLTPPFALGAFVAAGIAGSDPMRTGFTSLKLATALYIVPFIIAYSPAILMGEGTSWGQTVFVWGTSFLGFYCSATALEGYLRRKLFVWERVLFIVSAVFLWTTIHWLNLIGLVGMVVALVIQFMIRGERRVETSLQAAK